MRAPRAERYAESLLRALQEALESMGGGCSVEGNPCVINEYDIDEAPLPERMKRPDAVIVVRVRCGSRSYTVAFSVEYAGGKRGQPRDYEQAESREAVLDLVAEHCGVRFVHRYIPVVHMHGALRAPPQRPPVRVSCDTSVNRSNVVVLRGWLSGLK